MSYLVDLLNRQDFLGAFLVFCRVGTAFVLLPGFSNARIPLTVRLLLALAVSASVYAFVGTSFLEIVAQTHLLQIILGEFCIGLFFGFLCSLFSHAVRFFAHFTMSLIGLAGIPGQPVDDLEPNPAFVSILSMCFVVLIFAVDAHLLSLRALIETYKTYPLGQFPAPALFVDTLASSLRDTSLMALQAASPFVLHGLGINFALGLIGKLTPQLQAYFALLGISTLAAFLGLYFIGSPLLSFLVSSYFGFLEHGL